MTAEARFRAGVRVLMVLAMAAALVVPASLTAEASTGADFTIVLDSKSTSSVRVDGKVLKPGKSIKTKSKLQYVWFGKEGQKCDYAATNVFTKSNGTKETTKTAMKNVASSSWGGTLSKTVKITLKVTNCYTPKKVTASVSKVFTGKLSASIQSGSTASVPRTTTYMIKPTTHSLAVKGSKACKVAVYVNSKIYRSTTQKKSHSIRIPYASKINVVFYSCKS